MNKNNKTKTNRTPLGGILVMLAIFTTAFIGCDNDDDGGITPIEVAYVSLYNASPNAPALSVYADNRQVNTFPFDYSEYSGYRRFYTGDRNLKVGPYGADNTVIDTMVMMEDAHAYSIFIVNEYEDASLLVLEDNSDTPAEGKAMIRFVHTSPDAPAVDLAITGETGALVSDLLFNNGSDFMEIDADEYDLEVRDSSSDDVLLELSDKNLNDGWFYTFIVRGYMTPPGENQNVLSAEIVVN